MHYSLPEMVVFQVPGILQDWKLVRCAVVVKIGARVMVGEHILHRILCRLTSHLPLGGV